MHNSVRVRVKRSPTNKDLKLDYAIFDEGTKMEERRERDWKEKEP